MPGLTICANIWEGRLNGHPTCIALAPALDAIFALPPLRDEKHTRSSWLKRTKMKRDTRNCNICLTPLVVTGLIIVCPTCGMRYTPTERLTMN